MKNILIIFGRLPGMNIPAKTGLGKEIKNEMKARKIGHDLTKSCLNKFSSLKKIKKYFCYGGHEFLEKNKKIEKKGIIEKYKKQFSQYIFFPQKNSKKKDISGMFDAFEFIKNIQKNLKKKSKKSESYKILLIGTDIIGLDEQIILDCFDALNYFDSCIVPVEDLGYGAIGISKDIDIISEIKNFNSRTHGYNLIKETDELCIEKNISLFIHSQICFDIDLKEDAERAGLL